MPHLPYGPPNVRLIRPKRLPQALRDAGVALVEQKLSNSTVKDLVSISDDEWQIAWRRFNATQRLSQYRGRLQARVDSIAKMFGVTERTVRRWLSIYRKNPDIVALLPKSRGQRVGTRRLAPSIERLLNDVIDSWAAKAEHLPVAWIREEFKRRARSGQVMPSRRAIDARLRDRGLDSLGRQRFVLKSNAADVLTPRSRKALEIVQMDHTLCGHHGRGRGPATVDGPAMDYSRIRYRDACRARVCTQTGAAIRDLSRIGARDGMPPQGAVAQGTSS